MIYGIVILSYLLDGVFLNVLLSLVIVAPYFKKRRSSYYGMCVFLGFFYDTAYTNTYFLNTLLFLGIGFLVAKVFEPIQVSALNTYLIGLCTIVLYRVTVALFFLSLGLAHWDFMKFWKSITSSFFLNSAYLFLFFFFTKKIVKKLRKRKYRFLKIENLNS